MLMPNFVQVIHAREEIQSTGLLQTSLQVFIFKNKKPIFKFKSKIYMINVLFASQITAVTNSVQQQYNRPSLRFCFLWYQFPAVKHSPQIAYRMFQKYTIPTFWIGCHSEWRDEILGYPAPSCAGRESSLWPHCRHSPLLSHLVATYQIDRHGFGEPECKSPLFDVIMASESKSSDTGNSDMPEEAVKCVHI